MARIYFYFKLFNSIKEMHEVDFAELELLSLFGKVERIKNFLDVINTEPLKVFTAEDVRIQDALTHELPYGRYQGFLGTKDEIEDLSLLAERLAYFREFVMVTEEKDPESLLQKIFRKGIQGKNVQYFQKGNLVLFRFITHQYFLEKSQYISKISRNEEEIDRNLESLFQFLFRDIYRIPATETMAVGKRLQDYFAIREEPSLHLTHYMHPYKGKFHPKMVRALLNYVYPRAHGLVMDNFSGSGTLLVEATWMGLNSRGVEINPLSALMSNVKCFSLALDPTRLKAVIVNFLGEVEKETKPFEQYAKGYSLLLPAKYDFSSIMQFRKRIPSQVSRMFKDPGTIDKILVTHEIVKIVEDEQIRYFLLLGLSGAISDLTRRTSADFLEVLAARLNDLYLRIYLFQKLNEVLRITLGKSETYIGDTRNMKENCKRFCGEEVSIEDSSIDGIVNSPPYSTALDYIRNDLPQLVLMNLTSSLEKLEAEIMGNPNLKYYPEELLHEIQNGNEEFARLPSSAKEYVGSLIDAGRPKDGLRIYKFFKDMYLSIGEMHRVLKKKSKCAIIIGNNHYKLDGNYEEVKNDEVVQQIAEKEGFKLDRVITRELEKSMSGMIRYESIVILEKDQ